MTTTHELYLQQKAERVLREPLWKEAAPRLLEAAVIMEDYCTKSHKPDDEGNFPPCSGCVLSLVDNDGEILCPISMVRRAHVLCGISDYGVKNDDN